MYNDVVLTDFLFFITQVIQSSLRILPFSDAIRCQIASENSVFPRKTSRIRPRFRQNLCGRIPDRITPEKIRSVLVESDYRRLSKPPESYVWKEPYNTEFYNRSSRILPESGNRIPDQFMSESSQSDPLRFTYRITSDVAKYGENGFIQK